MLQLSGILKGPKTLLFPPPLYCILKMHQMFCLVFCGRNTFILKLQLLVVFFFHLGSVSMSIHQSSPAHWLCPGYHPSLQTCIHHPHPPILSSQSYNIHQAVRQPIYVSPPLPLSPDTPFAPPAVVHPRVSSSLLLVCSRPLQPADKFHPCN